VTLDLTLNRLETTSGLSKYRAAPPTIAAEDIVGTCLTRFKEPLLHIELENLQFLAPLPNDCAARIWKAYALLDRVRSWVLCCDHADDRVKTLLFHLAPKNADEWLALYDRAESLLKATLQEFKAAAQLDVPDTHDRP